MKKVRKALYIPEDLYRALTLMWQKDIELDVVKLTCSFHDYLIRKLRQAVNVSQIYDEVN